MRKEKRRRNIELIYSYAFEHQNLDQLAAVYKLSSGRVGEIIWTFLEHNGYKPILHPGRLSPNLVLRVVPREKLMRLYDMRPVV